MEILRSLLFMLGEMAPYILLGFLIAGLLHEFVSQRMMTRHLSGNGAGAVVKAAMIGVPLPLCSCGVLPTAVAMRRGGASRAASTSFLISTPQTGVDSIAATWSLLGPAFAVVRPIAALATALFGGMAVGRWGAQDDGATGDAVCAVPDEPDNRKRFGARVVDALRYGFVDLVGSIGGWLVAGLVIAAVITVYVPDDFFAALGDRPVFAMMAVLVVAVPMYVCATGSIPIAMSLMLKGLSPGTALVLLMAGPAANFASYTLIAREMGHRSAMIYVASIVLGSMAFGLAIDYLLPGEWWVLPGGAHGACHGEEMSWVSMASAAVLAVLLLVALVKRLNHKHLKITDMTKTYVIKGMNCPHCQAAVTKSIAGVKGVSEVTVNLSSGVATVNGEHDEKEVVNAVRAAGFDVD